MTANEIVSLLAARHKEDVFVPECKNGPTQTGRHVRLDAWAMPRSWSHPAVTGYEVKVSRSDFLNDNKWHSYLPLCNLLWFVCPSGLIQEREVPEGVGLLWVASTGRSLRTMRKAPHRDVQIPESLFRYVLMCRSRIRPSGFDEMTRADRWREWLSEKKDNRKLGYLVSRAVREHVETVERENRRLKEQMAGYDEIRKMLAALGVKNVDTASTYSVERRVRELSQIVPDGFESDLRSVAASVGRIQRQLEEMKKGDA